MKIPVIEGLIDRRILVNFRVDPTVLAPLLPAPFRPQLANGAGMAGVCLIRLKQIRPRGLPGFLGISSENAAHRIAVEWDEGGTACQGVYIPRRDTSSRLNTLVGGRLFPGVHHHATFDVRETAEDFHVALASADGSTRVEVDGRVATDLPSGSIFRSLAEASRFFERGALGYSETRVPGTYDGLELRSRDWRVEPLDVTRLESSFFSDTDRFPKGSAVLDCALLMRHIHHEWHGRTPLCAQPVAG